MGTVLSLVSLIVWIVAFAFMQMSLVNYRRSSKLERFMRAMFVIHWAKREGCPEGFQAEIYMKETGIMDCIKRRDLKAFEKKFNQMDLDRVEDILATAVQEKLN